MDRIIVHIDFDSFFASCEQQLHPELRGKPVGVTATNGRTCIIASSVEAKRRGVGTASRTFDAKRLCPEIILVPADFFKYWEISRAFVEICKDYTPYVEVFSIDEVFMDVTATAHLFGGLPNLIRTIKYRLKQEVGDYLTVSVGVSYNKILAKLASGLRKPNGLFKIDPQNLQEAFRIAKLTDMCGIGYRIALRLNALGIYSLLDLQNTPLSLLIHEFGNVEGHFLYNVSHGIDNSPVIPYYTPETIKSVGRQYCLPKNEYDQKIVLQNIFELCEEVGIKLRKLGKRAQTVGLALRGATSERGMVTINRFITSGKDIFSVCKYLYDAWKWNAYVRQMGIWVAGLEDDFGLQLGLFEASYKKTKLIKAVDTINNRFGDHTVRNGFLLYADKLTTKPNGFVG